ncbi:MAG: hypothetical protein R2867_11720 [Caldilineaceae bacterium]
MNGNTAAGVIGGQQKTPGAVGDEMGRCLNIGVNLVDQGQVA